MVFPWGSSVSEALFLLRAHHLPSRGSFSPSPLLTPFLHRVLVFFFPQTSSPFSLRKGGEHLGMICFSFSPSVSRALMNMLDL